MHMHHVPSNCGTTALEGMAQEDFAATETERKLGLQQTWWRLIFNQVGSSTVSYMVCMIPRISSHSPSSGATAATRMAGRPPLRLSGGESSDSPGRMTPISGHSVLVMGTQRCEK